MKLKKLLLPMAILAVVLVSVQCEKMDKVNAAETVTAASIGQKMEPMTAIAMDVEIAEEGLEQVMLCAYNCLNSLPTEAVSTEEAEALSFMREEEFLAHDVYSAMYALYPLPIFNNISNSESIHAYAMKVLLDKYNLPDPAADHQPGVFYNVVLQEMYNDLVALGTQNITNALIVGATIEDVDIADLEGHLENSIDNIDITYAFEMLNKGSRNHLRAFNGHLVFRGIVYTPQHISQERFDAITGSAWEIGQGFCQCQCSNTINNEPKRTE